MNSIWNKKQKLSSYKNLKILSVCIGTFKETSVYYEIMLHMFINLLEIYGRVFRNES